MFLTGKILSSGKLVRSRQGAVFHIGMILATTINVNSTVARRGTNSAAKDELKGKP